MFFILLGIGFLAIGIMTHLGVFKGWWLTKSSPASPRSIVYGAYPMTLVWFLMAYIFQPSVPMETRQQLVDYIGIPLILCTVIFTIWQPNWLKPKWLRWLETNHSNILKLLWEEARKEEWSLWNERVKTQEGLEEWIAEVRRKHKLN